MYERIIRSRQVVIARDGQSNADMVQVSGEYGARGQTLWEQTQTALEQADLPQASEKLWGADAQAVKSVAEARGWPHMSHRGLYDVISRLQQETGQQRLGQLLAIASALHQNFYEGWMPLEQVRDRSANIHELRETLGALMEPLGL